MEVLDYQGTSIPGLYAAGIDVGGWETDVYDTNLSGSALGFSLNSGRIAGENAARFVLRE
jgi:fumarate reductase flavoprotein subunit